MSNNNETNMDTLNPTQSIAPARYTVAVESMDEAIRLFGVFDENLRIIQQETGACIKSEADCISITGEEKEASLAHVVVDKLRILYLSL